MITRRSAVTAALALASAAFLAEAAAIKKLSNKELKALIETAKTPAEHKRLADYYAALAVEYEEESKDHTAQAAAYAKNPSIQESKMPGAGNTVSHCKFLATKYSEMAETARMMSTMHADMAKTAH